MKNLKIPRKLKKEIVKVESKLQSAVWVKPQIIGVLLKPGVKRNKWTNKLINRIINEQKTIFKNLVQENINNLKIMANKGCNNCLHYKIGEMKMWEDDIPSKCLLGKDEEFRLWWEENGRKRNTDEITDMDCFQETKLSEFCNEASRILDEMCKVVVRE